MSSLLVCHVEFMIGNVGMAVKILIGFVKTRLCHFVLVAAAVGTMLVRSFLVDGFRHHGGSVELCCVRTRDDVGGIDPVTIMVVGDFGEHLTG